MNKLFKCKHRMVKSMDVEHMMAKEDCIARINMKSLKEQSSNSLQKLNPYYILLSAIYSFYNDTQPSKAWELLIDHSVLFNCLIPWIGNMVQRLLLLTEDLPYWDILGSLLWCLGALLCQRRPIMFVRMVVALSVMLVLPDLVWFGCVMCCGSMTALSWIRPLLCGEMALRA